MTKVHKMLQKKNNSMIRGSWVKTNSQSVLKSKYTASIWF